jgi:hypothetical protein
MCAGLGLLVMAAGWTKPRTLSDRQLDAVFAAGFEVKVDLGLDIAASKPDAVYVQGGNQGAIAGLLNSTTNLATTRLGARNEVTVDPSGTNMPNLQNLTVNNINISQNALQNATTLMNVFAMEGDVAIGVNLNVVVNPINSNFNIAQTNVNWGMLHVNDGVSLP